MTTKRALSRLLGIVSISLEVVCVDTNATTIVGARTANEIVIGADSKVTDTYGKELTSHLLRINPQGAKWIQKKQECAELKPFRKRVNARPHLRHR
ncbi:MAG TPA: hypothetical protein VF899_15330 [Pyrinomonadaceae bacterium]